MVSDRHNALATPRTLLGVFARFGDMAGIDPLLLRVLGLMLLCLAFKLTVAAYCVSAVALRLAR